MKSLLGVILVFILAYVIGYWLKQPETTTDLVLKSGCDPSLKVCRIEDAQYGFNVYFKGAASPLVPFDIVIEPDHTIRAARVSFNMQDMDMGYNTHQLKNVNGQWRATVILPVCTLGRNDWILQVLIEAENQAAISSEFSFKQPDGK